MWRQLGKKTRETLKRFKCTVKDSDWEEASSMAMRGSINNCLCLPRTEGFLGMQHFGYSKWNNLGQTRMAGLAQVKS